MPRVVNLDIHKNKTSPDITCTQTKHASSRESWRAQNHVTSRASGHAQKHAKSCEPWQRMPRYYTHKICHESWILTCTKTCHESQILTCTTTKNAKTWHAQNHVKSREFWQRMPRHYTHKNKARQECDVSVFTCKESRISTCTKTKHLKPWHAHKQSMPKNRESRRVKKPVHVKIRNMGWLRLVGSLNL